MTGELEAWDTDLEDRARRPRGLTPTQRRQCAAAIRLFATLLLISMAIVGIMLLFFALD
jgi:hypothetical protein